MAKEETDKIFAEMTSVAESPEEPPTSGTSLPPRQGQKHGRSSQQSAKKEALGSVSPQRGRELLPVPGSRQSISKSRCRRNVLWSLSFNVALTVISCNMIWRERIQVQELSKHRMDCIHLGRTSARNRKELISISVGIRLCKFFSWFNK